MTALEWVMTNWEVIGILLNALFGVLWLRQRNSLECTKIRLKETESKAETAKADSQQDMAIIRLLEGQIANGSRQAAAIEESNTLARQEAERNAEERRQFAAFVSVAIDSHKQTTAMIADFQSFSATQHNQTRDTVNAVGGKVDTVIENLQQASEDAKAFRTGMNGRFNILDTQLKERFESLQHNLNEGLKKTRDTDKLDPAKLDHAPDAGDGSAAA